MDSARENAREEVPTDGLVDWANLSAINWQVRQQFPSASLSDVQNATLELVRSLVAEGLFELGDLSSEDGRFAAWDEPLEISMPKLYDAYVTHYSDAIGWPHRYWLSLTDRGKDFILSTEKGKQVAQAELARQRAIKDSEGT